MLLTSIIGNDDRTTKDMDASLKGIPLNMEKIQNIFNEILNIDLKDKVHFQIISIKEIMIDHPYGGYRLNILSQFDVNKTYITVEIMTGDIITPKEIKYHYNCFFQDKQIPILAYNIETILAEKIHAITSHGLLTTRLKDYYDVYTLVNNPNITFDNNLLLKAVQNTFENRDKVVDIHEFKSIISDIEESNHIKKLWQEYQNKNLYAKNIKHEDTIQALKKLINILEKELITK